MKKIVGLGAVLIVLSCYAYITFLKPERQKREKLLENIQAQKAEDLVQFNISDSDKVIKLVKKDGFWWVIEPNKYMANQEFIEKAIRIMKESPVKSDFPLKEDLFGLTPGRAFIEWVYKDGFRKRMVVGDKAAPGDNIYVLDKDSSHVYIYHNIWGQVLYYPLSQFYHQYLPIPGRLVKTIQYKVAQKTVWSIQPANNNKMSVFYQGESFLSSKAKWVWFFKKIREFSLKNLEFKKGASFNGTASLIVESDKGNIRFQFDMESKKMFINGVNVFADFDPYSLNSLGYEIEKVMKSDKK